MGDDKDGFGMTKGFGFFLQVLEVGKKMQKGGPGCRFHQGVLVESRLVGRMH